MRWRIYSPADETRRARDGTAVECAAVGLDLSGSALSGGPVLGLAEGLIRTPVSGFAGGAYLVAISAGNRRAWPRPAGASAGGHADFAAAGACCRRVLDRAGGANRRTGRLLRRLARSHRRTGH